MSPDQPDHWIDSPASPSSSSSASLASMGDRNDTAPAPVNEAEGWGDGGRGDDHHDDDDNDGQQEREEEEALSLLSSVEVHRFCVRVRTVSGGDFAWTVPHDQGLGELQLRGMADELGVRAETLADALLAVGGDTALGSVVFTLSSLGRAVP
jgi:hypothetical protein